MIDTRCYYPSLPQRRWQQNLIGQGSVLHCPSSRIQNGASALGCLAHHLVDYLLLFPLDQVINYLIQSFALGNTDNIKPSSLIFSVLSSQKVNTGVALAEY